MLYDAQITQEFANELLKEGKNEHTVIKARLFFKGVYVIGFSYPVVPEGKARIRVQLSAMHKENQLKQAVEKFLKVTFHEMRSSTKSHL